MSLCLFDFQLGFSLYDQLWSLRPLYIQYTLVVIALCGRFSTYL